MPPIPPLELVGDTIQASLYTLEHGLLLAFGTPPRLPASALHRPHGPLMVRYALPYLRAEQAIVPGLFASEYGAMLVGREAWDYTWHHNNLHPRADLLGFRTDGQEDQIMLRDLDFGRGVEVWVYATAEARIPLAQITAYWKPAGYDIPDLLAEHAPNWRPESQP